MISGECGQWFNIWLNRLTSMCDLISSNPIWSYMHGTLGPTNKIRWCVSEFELTSTEVQGMSICEVATYWVEEFYKQWSMSPQCCIVDTRWWQLKYFLFSPRKLGKIPILTNMFQMGWNHQLVIALTSPFCKPLQCFFVCQKSASSAFLCAPKRFGEQIRWSSIPTCRVG